MAALSLGTAPPPGAALALAVRPGAIPAELAAAARAARCTGAAGESAVLVGPERVTVLVGLGV
ncbi:MAG: hypothetical protein KGL12_00365, partial [Rhodospirillales bacterium]|nr:hypothetical protein [Rhodospirillales bacterium]